MNPATLQGSLGTHAVSVENGQFVARLGRDSIDGIFEHLLPLCKIMGVRRAIVDLKGTAGYNPLQRMQQIDAIAQEMGMDICYTGVPLISLYAAKMADYGTRTYDFLEDAFRAA